MKTKIKLSFCTYILASLTIIFVNSCKEDPVSSQETPNETETYKQIVQTAVHNNATGFEAVMKSIFTGNQSRTDFLRTYLNYNRYFPDSTGYFYVNDFSGINIAHGTNLSLQGQNRWDVKDSKGTYYIQNLISNAKNYVYDFVIYYYLNPSTNLTETKHAYAEAIKGTSYALTSGFYLEKDVKRIPNLEKNKLIVTGVAHTFAFGSGAVCKTLLTTPAEQTDFFRTFAEPVKFLPDSSGYIFVVNLSGLCIAHGANKTLEGTNVMELHDFQGTYFIKQMINLAKNPGYGYVEYYYTNPATNLNEQKLVYIERIQGTDYLVGTGVY